MNELNYPEITKHVIISADGENYTYHVVEPQNCFATGQPFMYIFDSEEEAKLAYPQAFKTEETVEDNLNPENILI
jgi:hypothetical protein